MTLILASASPRRRELLTRLLPSFEVIVSRVDERLPRPGEDPAAYALALAREKAADVAGRHPGDVVLGADTVVAVEGQMLGKPESPEDAARMLRLLRGKAHTVVTAVSVRRRGGEREGAVAAEVWMRDFSDDQINRYVATGEPMDKAGAYAVQGLGGALVERVVGCYNTVVGLPLCLTRDLLAECGLRDQLSPDARCDHRTAAGARNEV